MFYDSYYWGMNLIWWIAWIVLICWIFAIPYDIPGQRKPKENPLEILRKRFASGKITLSEYQEKKSVLEHDLATFPK